jgi:hypothetical protein
MEQNKYFFYPLNLQTKTKSPLQSTSTAIIVKNSFFLQNEIHAFNILESIFNYENHFYIFDSFEYTTYNEITKKERSNTITESNYVLLHYKDKSLYSLYDYILSIENNNHKFRIILDSYLYLLEAILITSENNLVHNNINSNKIFLNDLSIIKPIIMKFDYSMHITSENNINLLEYVKPYLLDYMPFELHVLSFLFKNQLDSLSNSNIEDIINNIFASIYKNILNEQKFSQYKEESYHFLNKYINKSILFISNDIFVYYKTWDNYNLSIYYLEILKNSNANTNLYPYLNILLQNIHPNPNKRYNIKESITMVENSLFNLDTSFLFKID